MKESRYFHHPPPHTVVIMFSVIFRYSLSSSLLVEQEVVSGGLDGGEPDLVGRVGQTGQQHLLDHVDVLLLLVATRLFIYYSLKIS